MHLPRAIVSWPVGTKYHYLCLTFCTDGAIRGVLRDAEGILVDISVAFKNCQHSPEILRGFSHDYNIISI